jgi:hypothetical protein
MDGEASSQSSGDFWSHTERIESGCILWTAGSSGDQYGSYWDSVTKKDTRAHRYAYAITTGDPAGFDVLHTCDVRACVNPEHLYLGDAAQNARDRESRNPGTQRRGATHPRSKLTWEQVVEMRVLASEGWSQRQLATYFRVAKSSVQQILAGKNRVDA